MSNETGEDEDLVRTADSGMHWRPVSPVRGPITLDALDGTTAFVATGPTSRPVLYRTVDGGQAWRRLATLPAPCGVEFVDVLHGWCVEIGAASGSENVDLWRTTDGGSQWALASRTGAGDVNGTPNAIPFGCDKSVVFTTPTEGWAPLFCAGGTPSLYKSTDAGTTWRPNPSPPLPRIPTDGGAGYGGLVANGSDIGLVTTVQRTSAIATSRDDGLTWTTHPLPRPDIQWDTTLVDATHWRLRNNRVLLSTDDAGRHWHTDTLPPFIPASDDMRFLAPQLAWAIPSDPTGGPIWWSTGGHMWRPVTVSDNARPRGQPVSTAMAFDVPWVDRPAPPFFVPEPVPTTAPPADAPPCEAGGVSIAADGRNGGGGNQVDFLRVKNVGSSPCRLGDYPPRVVATEPGHPDVVARDGAYFGDPGPAANVAPGRAGELSITTSDRCIMGPTPPPEYHTLLVTFPGGGVVSVHGNLGVSCGLATSRFGVPQPALVTAAVVRVGEPDDASAANGRRGHDTHLRRHTHRQPREIREDRPLRRLLRARNGRSRRGHRALRPQLRRRAQHRRARPVALRDEARCSRGRADRAHDSRVDDRRPALATRAVNDGAGARQRPSRAAGQVAGAATGAATPFRGAGIYWVKDAGTTLDVALTNTSATSCTRQGSPGVAIFSSRGTVLPLEYVTHGFGIGRRSPAGSRVTLAPGQSAASTLVWHSRWCAPNPNPVRVELTLPGNSNVVTFSPTHGWAPPTCRGFAWNSISSEPFR